MRDTKQFATKIRLKTCEMLLHTGYGHLGAALSIVETLAVLYDKIMTIDPNNPELTNRDWFVLSKGHGGPSYYATLALKGFFKEEKLFTLNQNNTELPSHPDWLKIEGVDVTTGSLGQGVSQAVGVAKGLQIQNKESFVYCIVGDGECNEGQVYEAAIFAVAENLDNFILFVDNNKKQLDGYTSDISIKYDFKTFFETLGFDAYSVDGNNVNEIEAAIRQAQKVSNKPHCIVLDTTKCQGIPYFENMLDNHHIRFNEQDKAHLIEAINLMKEELNHGNA